VFQNIEWSTEKVLEQTKAQIKDKGYSYTLLPALHDVDTVKEVPPQWLEEA
jgi:glycosyltransferase A (GT-A) superfamily protein (DUF2064 family)